MLLYDLLKIHSESKKLAVIDDVGKVMYSELMESATHTRDFSHE